MVHFVGAGPGGPDLITLRGAELLGRADCVVYAGSLVNPALLGLVRESVPVYNSAQMTLEQVLEVVDRAADAGARFIYPCFDSRTSPTVDNQPYRKMKTFSQLSGKEIGGGTAINGRFR